MQYPNFDRRRMLGALGGILLVAPAISGAQSIDFMGSEQAKADDSSEGFLPYRVVTTNPIYKNRVVELFDFACPYCRQINNGAQAWGASLPKPFVFEQMPLVFDKTSAEIAAIYYTVVLANPAIKSAIVSSIFHSVQDLHENPAAPKTYVQAAVQAGVTREQFLKASKDDKGRAAYVMRAAAFARAVKPRSTPTFVVDNKAIDAQDTSGDYQKLFRLLDGFVSQGLPNFSGKR